MPSSKTWKYLGVGFLGGLVGSIGLVVSAILIVTLWPSGKPAQKVSLADIGCPSGMIENLATDRCEASEKTVKTISASLGELRKLKSPIQKLNVPEIRKLAEKPSGKPKLSFKLYLIAALLGDATSQYEIGGLLSNGTGVREDDLEALRWLHESAHNDHLGAQLTLSRMLASGTFVEKDEQMAQKWLKRAEANRSQAQLAELEV